MNPIKELRKGFISYYKTSDITCLWKYLDADHPVIKNNLKKKNNQGRENVEKQPTKKRAHISNSSILNFFALKDPFKKVNVEQKMFMENPALLIMKNHLPLQFVKSVWLKCLVLQLCLCVPFLS